MTYDSNEELHFSWWIDELLKAGYITAWRYHPVPFKLSDSVSVKYVKQLKTKSRIEEKGLLREHIFQADFYIVWNEKAIRIFYPEVITENKLSYPLYSQKTASGIIRSVVDVKGSYNQNNTHRIFSIEQKWVYQRYGIYVQKVIPKKLFATTFTPSRYLITDVSGKTRKLNYKPILNLQDYVRLKIKNQAQKSEDH